MTMAAPTAAGRRRFVFRAAAAVLACASLIPAAAPVFAGSPTLTTITIDGNTSDWTAVRMDPDNIIYDGPGGGLLDADSPVDPALNIEEFAYTWDGTYLYFFVRRVGYSSDIRYFWFFIDGNNDGILQSGEPAMRVRWNGSNGRLSTRDDTYTPAGSSGDPSSINGVHDGYVLPGTTSNGPAIENIVGGSSSGLEMESRYSWADMGLTPGSFVDIHVTATNTQNAFPGGMEDNAGRRNYSNVLDIFPDRTASVSPGATAVFAHTLENNGSIADRVNLAWSSTGGFMPTGVSFHIDADGSGTLTPGDSPLGDGDGDGKPDAGPVAAGGGRVDVLVSVATPPGGTLGTAATLTVTASSGLNPSITGSAVDVVTLSGPSLTLVKVASTATVAPGGTIAYTVTYTNTGSDTAQGVEIVDLVPVPAVYVPGSATGAGTAVSWSHDGGITFDLQETAPVTHIRWTLASSLGPAGSGTVSFSVVVP